MEFPKFIIHGEDVIFGHVGLHEELKLSYVEEKPLGGGRFRFDREVETMYLMDRSHDFGPTTPEMFEGKYFPPSMRGVKIIHINLSGVETEITNHKTY